MYQSQRSWVRILTGAIYQNKLQPTHILCLRPTGAAREGECWTISEMSTFPHQFKLLGATGRCRVANSADFNTWLLAPHQIWWYVLLWFSVILVLFFSFFCFSIGDSHVSESYTILFVVFLLYLLMTFWRFVVFHNSSEHAASVILKRQLEDKRNLPNYLVCNECAI
jgi:hypothetical protein